MDDRGGQFIGENSQRGVNKALKKAREESAKRVQEESVRWGKGQRGVNKAIHYHILIVVSILCRVFSRANYISSHVWTCFMI